MREITTKYDGVCRKCDLPIEAGETVVYEKRVGIFHLGCAPTDPEEIRALRQEAADRKADRLEGWAAKRREKAAALERQNDPYRGDHAFNTQPGHIPERARANSRSERAWEHTKTAQRMEDKAARLRIVRVKGDAERRREAERERVRQWIKKGMRVFTAIWGEGTVKRVNKKTATIANCGTSGTYTVAVDLSWIHPVEVKE